MMDKYMYITFFVGFLLPASVEGCLLPFSDGTWISSTRGTWTTSNNGTHSVIQNFDADLTTTLATTPDLTCVSSSGTQYILGTSFELFVFEFIDVYICIDFRTTTVSPNSYVYYIVTPTDTNTGEQFTSNINNACTNSNFETAINTHVLLQQGSETSAAVNCPDDILGNYTVDYTDVDGNSITGSEMDSCNATTHMVFTNADANTKLAFTNDNVVQCLHSVTSGSNVYVHTYNTDTAAADNTNTFSIACWTIVNSGTQVQATAYPSECIQGQSSTSVPYGGQEFVFTPRYTCPLNQASSKGLAGWAIALIVLGVLAAIFIIVLIILYIRYMRKERHVKDADLLEKGDLKEKKHPPPATLPVDDIDKEKAKIKREEECDSGFEGSLKARNKKVREHTFDLTELIKPKKKLQEGNVEEKEVKVPVKPVVIPPEKKPVPQPTPKTNDQITPKEPIEFPPGKKQIPPTTPKPDENDSTLLRVKKERERKERERLEKKKKEKEAQEKKEKKEEKPPEEKASQVLKTVRTPSSSDEYETDESEKAERIQKLLQKRKRLAAAAYQPPEGLPDATVVGRKKKRMQKEGEEANDLTKYLTTREQQELEDSKRRQRKKAIKRMAKKKFRSPSDIETSDSEADTSSAKRRYKKRKVGDPRGKEAPYTEQYHVKKDIEKELDDIDYWKEKVQPTEISDSEEIDEDGNIKKRAIQVAPMETAQAPKSAGEERSALRLEKIMEEEADVWAAHGLKGFKLGRGGELPEGFHFDDGGNIVRDADGKVVPKEAFAKQMESRRKFGFVFSLPRLIRDTDGRPLGGYKDDEFGPTAEWDYGLPSGNEEEEELKKIESHRQGSGKQVAFSVQDGENVEATPLKDLDYSQIKGRQLGSAERMKLKERLFEPKTESEVQTTVPVYFLAKKGGVKPESVYIDNTQVERQDQKKAGSQVKPHMVVRSDTFDDGRRMNRNSKLRASWSGRERTIPAFIPEEVNGEGKQGIQGISKEKRNIGSDDEFILVPGSMRKLNKPPETTDSHLATHWCSRYERQGHLRSREPTELSDLNMHTAPSSHRPFEGGDRKMRHLLQELYTDKKYFDHYLKAERLPTNAAVETRGLASHGVEFLKERAEYWNEHEPVNPPVPPSELALRLSRMHTFHTAGDSGMDSVMSNATGRPHSADDAQESIRTGRENSNIVPPLKSNRSVKTVDPSTERKPPTGRSEFAPSPSKLESSKKEKTVTIDDSPRKNEKLKYEVSEPVGNLKNGQNVSNERILAGNVLSLTDT